MMTLAPGDIRGSLAAYDAFALDLASLRTPEPLPEADVDPECDPVPLAEESS